MIQVFPAANLFAPGMIQVFAVANCLAIGMVGVFFSYLTCRLWIGCYPY